MFKIKYWPKCDKFLHVLLRANENKLDNYTFLVSYIISFLPIVYSSKHSIFLKIQKDKYKKKSPVYSWIKHFLKVKFFTKEYFSLKELTHLSNIWGYRWTSLMYLMYFLLSIWHLTTHRSMRNRLNICIANNGCQDMTEAKMDFGQMSLK